MEGKTTIKYLQSYIKQKDYKPEMLKDYFLKLTEEGRRAFPSNAKKS